MGRQFVGLWLVALAVGCGESAGKPGATGGNGTSGGSAGATGGDANGAGSAGVGDASGGTGAAATSGGAGASGGLATSGAAGSGGSMTGDAARGVGLFDYGSCALDSRGELQCWGEKTDEGHMWPLPTGPFVEIVGGSDLVCVIRADRSYACFNDPMVGFGSSAVPFAPDLEVESVATNAHFVCAAGVDGTPACGQQGSMMPWDMAPPAGLKVKAISTGYGYACGIDAVDSSIKCWGEPARLVELCPELATAGLTEPPPGAFVAIAGSWWSTCAIDTAGAIHCWGAGKAGDDPAAACQTRPFNRGQGAPPEGAFVQLAVSWNHTCAIRTDGTVACWGAGTTDECDLSVDYDARCRQSRPPAGQFRQVSVGFNHSCGLDEAGKVQCWGYDGEGDTAGRTQVPLALR